MRTQRAPLVSVIIPAYNAAETLVRTIASALAQTHRELEVLVVDDGSTDDTRALAEHAALADSRVRVLVRPSNGGVARARNLGVEEARGAYLAPLDADDLWHPTKVEKQLRALERAGSDTAFAYCAYRRIGAQDQVLGTSPAFRLRGRVVCRHVLVNFVGNGSALLARRDAVRAVGGYAPSLRDEGLEGVEDFLLQLQLASRWGVEAVPEYLVGYRARPDAMSEDVRRMALSRLRVLEAFAQQCAAVPGHAFRWGAAPYLVRCATRAARQERTSLSLALLLRALRLDPFGAVAQLAEIVWENTTRADAVAMRLAAPLRGKMEARLPPRHFYAYGTTEEPNESTGWLRKLRLAQLARYDLGQVRARGALDLSAFAQPRRAG